MTTILAALVLLQEPSETARKARADFDRIRDEIQKAGEELQTKLASYQRDYAAAKAGGDEAKCKEIMKKFEAERAAVLKPAEDFHAGLNASIKAAPADVDLLDVRRDLLLLKGDSDGYADDAEAAAKLKPDDAARAALAARALYQINRYQPAADLADRVLAKDPKHAEAAAVKGLCDFALEKFADAQKRLDNVNLQGLPQDFQRLVQMTAPAAKAYRDHVRKEEELRAAEAKANDLPRVKLTTSRGEIEVELFENEAPNAVASFVSLAESKFFDGIKFHRVVPNFMIQGGDPNSKDDDPSNDGQGGPGYRFNDELEPGKYRIHFRGSLSMANSGPNTNGSQFFITHLPTAHLNGKHVVFGRVLKGQEVVDAIRAGDVIRKAEVIRKRAHEYKPKVEK